MVTTRSGKSYTIDAQVKRKRAPAKKKAPPVNAKQVRKMIMGLSETKRYHYATTAGVSVVTGTQYNINPLYWIPIGVTENSRVGDKIFIQSIDVHLKIDRSNLNVPSRFGNNHIPICVKLVRHVQKAHQGTVGDAGFTALGLPDMRFDALGNAALPMTNKQEYQVIWEYQDIIPQMPVENPSFDLYNGITVTKRIPINRQFLYDGVATTGSSGYSKDYNYYFYLACDSQATTALSSCYVHSDIMVNFKDL